MGRTIHWTALGCLVALLAGLGGCAPSRPPKDTAPAPPHPAYELLRGASEMQTDQVGYFATPSPYAAAFRELLSTPQAKQAFHALLREGTVAGRIYGVAGLYFVDPDAFPSHVERLAESGKTVTLRNGCVSSEMEIKAYVKSGSRMRVAKGTTLAQTAGGGTCDVAGGCLPLTWLAGDRQAPREPL